MLLTCSVCYSLDNETKLFGKIFVIDIGHGGRDSGTYYKDILEKDINLQIGLKLRDKLLKKGAFVYLTRDGDYDLSSPGVSFRKKSDFDNRIKYINDIKPDMYFSIHINYLENSKYYGAQVFYLDSGKEYASVLQNYFISNLKSPLKEKRMSDDIYMYKRIESPGVLIECGFISNDNERLLLVDNKYQDLIVESIVQSLFVYY